MPLFYSANGPNEALATWAWAQAAASLTPAISQLAAATLQQHQQHLLKAYEAQIQAVAQQSATGSLQAMGTAKPVAPVAPPKTQEHLASRVSAIKAAAAQLPTILPAGGAGVAAKAGTNPNSLDDSRSKEDQAAGSMLMGFLSSLRKGYEEALSEKMQQEKKQDSSVSGRKRNSRDEKLSSSSKKPRASPSQRVGNAVTPAVSRSASSVQDGSYMSRAETSSGTTSYPADSSLEDSESSENDKGKDPSSSEESDRDFLGDQVSSGERGFGPPRKRLKGKHIVGKFTRKNIADHNHRMDAMRGTISQELPGGGSRKPRDERNGLEE